MGTLYKSDISPKEAWSILSEDNGATLLDVRTQAEWAFVGTPDLSSINKEVILKEWRMLGDMSINPVFFEELNKEIVDKTQKVIFLCRSGGRSAEAATLMTEHGFENCYNVDSGFEGDLDHEKHRGKLNGWKFDNLPWRQN